MSVTVLVIDYSVDWRIVLKNAKTARGNAIVVEQSEWSKVHVECDSSSARANVFLGASDAPLNSRQADVRQVSPDLLFVRNFPKGLQQVDYRNILLGFAMAGTPAINSVDSLLLGLDRPLMFGALVRIRNALGADKFPLIDLTYHANLGSGTNKLLCVPKQFPVVVKVSSTHAGFGKMRVEKLQDLHDLMSILCLNADYFTIEPFLDVEYEFRVQQIGKQRRSFRRNSSSSWKNNWGDLKFEEHEWTATYDAWLDVVTTHVRGLDMFALNVLHLKDGRDVILELNDSAFGLMFQHEKTDLAHMAALIVARLDAIEASASPPRALNTN